MKILVSGYHNPRFLTITEYIERAVRACGHECIAFDNRTYRIPGILRRKIPLLERHEIGRINRSLCALADACGPDLFLETGGSRILPSTVRRLHARGITTALWTIDVPLYFEPILKAAPHYDRIFCGGTEAIEVLSAHRIDGAQWLPFACDPAYHYPVMLSEEEKSQWGNAVVFVGSYYPNRHRLFSGLIDFDFGIWGPGWRERLSVHDPLRDALRGDHVRPDQWIKILSASKIAVVAHYRDEKIPCYQASPKVYEAMACGAFVLVDSQKDVISLFKENEQWARYATMEELKEKITYYLEEADRRMAIARKGRDEVLEKHTYAHRIRKMIESIH